jgi:Family of unknown function (DUF6049)
MPAERFAPRRPVKRLAGALAALVVLALAGTGLPAAAAAPAAAITVAAVPADSGDVTAGTALRLFVSLANGGVAATDAATVTVSAAPTPTSARSALADWFSGATKSTLATQAVGTADFPAVAGGLSGGVEVTIPAASLPFAAAGVYPISVSIASGTKTLGTARSAIAWNVGASAPVPVAIAVPLTVPAGESTFLTAAELSTYTAPGGVLTRELGDVENSGVAVGIDPRILASINVLGKSAPQTALDWLNELRVLPNETFPLAWADADLTAPLHAGQSSVLETKSLDYAIDPTQFPVPQPGSTNTPTPTPTSGSTTSPVPTSAELIAWNYTMPLLSWPAENSVETSDLAKLNQADITAAILSSTNIASPVGSGLGGGSAKAGNTTIAVSDSVLSGYLRTAIKSQTRDASSEAMTELTTTLALMSVGSGTSARPILITLGRNWANADTNFERSVSQIASHPWTSTTTLSTLLLKGAPTTVTIAKKAESPTRIDRISSMLAAEQGVVSFAPVAKNPDVLTSSTRLRLLSLLSNEWTAATWRTAADAFLTQAAKTVASVQVDPSSEILVTADQTSLPVSISNDLDQDITVSLQVRSLSTRLTVKDLSRVQTVTVDEGAQKRVLIPVSALSNGKAEIIATLVSSTGVQVGRAVAIQVNVQAGWETVGTLIFAALVVGLFAFGIVQTIRKRRRAAREPDAT